MQEADEAFNKLKSVLSTVPVLGLLDFNKQFVVEADACETGLGAVLSQDHRPIAFFSKALSGATKHLSTYKKEMLAVIEAVAKWRPYLLGRKFVIKIDHQSLKYFLNQ